MTVAGASVTVRSASWEHDRERLESVRRCVFVDEQGVPEDEEWDAADLTARHVLAVAADREPSAPGGSSPAARSVGWRCCGSGAAPGSAGRSCATS